MLLSLFTRNTAGKSIADLIISFSELLASVRACKLLFICNILSPAPACEPYGRCVVPPSYASPRRMPRAPVAASATAYRPPAPEHAAAAHRRSARPRLRAAVSRTLVKPATTRELIPLSATASSPLPNNGLRSSIGWNRVLLKAKIGFFDLGGGGLGNVVCVYSDGVIALDPPRLGLGVGDPCLPRRQSHDHFHIGARRLRDRHIVDMEAVDHRREHRVGG